MKRLLLKLSTYRDTLGLPTDKLNVNGGSISIGHPFGMTGSRQVGHVARELNRRDGKYGIVTMCVGGWYGCYWSL